MFVCMQCCVRVCSECVYVCVRSSACVMCARVCVIVQCSAEQWSVFVCCVRVLVSV